MDDGYSPVSMLILILFILLEGAFYGFGAAVQNVSEAKLEEDAQGGSAKAGRLLEIIRAPGRLIHTIQVTTHLIGLIIGAVILPGHVRGLTNRFQAVFAGIGGLGAVLPGRSPWWEWTLAGVLVTLFFLLIIVSFGIVVPKRLGAKDPEVWGYHLLPLILFFSTLFRPLTALITGISCLVLKAFGADLSQKEENVTEEDIMSMVNEGHEQGVLEAGETEMITNIFELGDKEACDIMTHRTNMTALEGTMPLKDAVHFILNEGVNTRYPVYGEDIDDIIGILHFRDAMACAAHGDKKDWLIKDIPGLLREATFIPETKGIDVLFKEMQSRKIHMVIVVDEYGQTAGLLTIEDILEEIVGNILDEYDEEEEFITPVGDGTYVMNGLTPLDDVMDTLDIEFADEDYDTYDTLNGFLLSRLERIPQEHEKPEVEFSGYCFKVMQAGNKMIESVLVSPASSEKDAGQETETGREPAVGAGKDPDPAKNPDLTEAGAGGLG